MSPDENSIFRSSEYRKDKRRLHASDIGTVIKEKIDGIWWGHTMHAWMPAD